MDYKKICKVHGELTEDQIKVYTRNRRGRSELTLACKLCHRKTASQARNKDRTKANEWARKDRKEHPEKYREWAKKQREKLGDLRNIREVCRRRGVSEEWYFDKIAQQDNVCAICKEPETRKSRTEGKTCRLVIDHNHETGEARELLCHNCNVVVGHCKESIEILEKTIEYIKKHS